MLIEEIEIALTRFYKEQKHIMIPNFYVDHECDLLVIRKTGYAIEVEIKRSVADMKKDLEKSHGHTSNKITEFYYCFPEKIADKCIPLVPKHAGILVVKKPYQFAKVSMLRHAKRNKDAVKWTPKEIKKVLRYCTYRMWKLKRDVFKLKSKKK